LNGNETKKSRLLIFVLLAFNIVKQPASRSYSTPMSWWNQNAAGFT